MEQMSRLDVGKWLTRREENLHGHSRFSDVLHGRVARRGRRCLCAAIWDDIRSRGGQKTSNRAPLLKKE